MSVNFIWLNFQVYYHFGDLTMSAFFLTFRKGSFFPSASSWGKPEDYLPLVKSLNFIYYCFLKAPLNECLAINFPLLRQFFLEKWQLRCLSFVGAISGLRSKTLIEDYINLYQEARTIVSRVLEYNINNCVESSRIQH